MRGLRKWLISCKQHFQMHFLQRSTLNFHENFIEVYSKGSNRQCVSIESGNNLTPNSFENVVYKIGVHFASASICLSFSNILITQGCTLKPKIKKAGPNKVSCDHQTLGKWYLLKNGKNNIWGWYTVEPIYSTVIFLENTYQMNSKACR